jgi:hypothetical protein
MQQSAGLTTGLQNEASRDSRPANSPGPLLARGVGMNILAIFLVSLCWSTSFGSAVIATYGWAQIDQFSEMLIALGWTFMAIFLALLGVVCI